MKPKEVKIIFITAFVDPADSDHRIRFYGLGDDERVYQKGVGYWFEALT